MTRYAIRIQLSDQKLRFHAKIRSEWTLVFTFSSYHSAKLISHDIIYAIKITIHNAFTPSPEIEVSCKKCSQLIQVSSVNHELLNKSTKQELRVDILADEVWFNFFSNF